ncbi:hypothetical protein A2526_06425 [candidate division WOR-1 bacterium RIFOXYD2_FULL_36_8]|uniref:Flagellar basal body rod protein N-terminal domain-containing protein n=1 Tax=candidate division WOR-1 bacterium RIFOXYB2_FULL_36_35 TaxID=1802578 RepID=A0A1F4S7E2_UNCSA|nr:MAG: hypothetical protein A2230_01680 [candidate division WOR-1 bacterium RIFOXYA2_FULL_36_21]OGC15681.1 MAG: hypothetical protein A2282_04365 [candidate division WOR-1 bacterium RIFOXYA12_FULL_36_13]OGC16321.1 MAG: hypothetical protein A2290_04405 [candidate division WOR-1 bacterium RIFOXYB2_FULL_36_35]OGC41733.1 MAG: hypothetical protein A2526_06425 [candidate division WOR-1 bacterium RIFOXYD2_FULL_36_8]
MFDPAYISLKGALGETIIKQEVAAHNLANINTPGFEPNTFDEVLQKVIKREDKKITVEQEMDEISQNVLRYSSLVKLLSYKINTLKTIASQGRR